MNIKEKRKGNIKLEQEEQRGNTHPLVDPKQEMVKLTIRCLRVATRATAK